MTRLAPLVHRLAISLALTGAVTPLAAQVGHAPDRSPYRDMTRTQFVTLIGSSFGGGGGRIGTAPHDGTLLGGRLEFLANRTLGIQFGFSTGTLERMIVDPEGPVDDRVSGPVDQTLTMVEFGVQLNVTGGKTWHNIAPFIGGGIGLAFSGDTPEDPSEFDFGNKFFFKPNIGARIFLSRSVVLRLEAASVFWKVTHPDEFALDPPGNPGNPVNSNAVLPGANLREWITNGVLTVGLGTAFSFPF